MDSRKFSMCERMQQNKRCAQQICACAHNPFELASIHVSLNWKTENCSRDMQCYGRRKCPFLHADEWFVRAHGSWTGLLVDGNGIAIKFHYVAFGGIGPRKASEQKISTTPRHMDLEKKEQKTTIKSLVDDGSKSPIDDRRRNKSSIDKSPIDDQRRRRSKSPIDDQRRRSKSPIDDQRRRHKSPIDEGRSKRPLTPKRIRQSYMTEEAARKRGYFISKQVPKKSNIHSDAHKQMRDTWFANAK